MLKRPSPRIAAARAWRIANKPYFDALYGSENDHSFFADQRRWGLVFARRWRAANAARFGRAGGKTA